MLENNNMGGNDMNEDTRMGITHEVKDVVETGMKGEEPMMDEVDEAKLSTWQMIQQYKAAVLWSAVMGLGAINWGMDVLASLILQGSILDANELSSQTMSSPSHRFRKILGTFSRTSISSATVGRLPSTALRPSEVYLEQSGQDILRMGWEKGRLWGLGVSSVLGRCSYRCLLPSQARC